MQSYVVYPHISSLYLGVIENFAHWNHYEQIENSHFTIVKQYNWCCEHIETNKYLTIFRIKMSG
jgi:hypothetical protein